MADDKRFDGDATDRVERDRRAPPGVWQDPRTWVSILGFLLSLAVIVGTYVGNQLSNLRSDVQAANLASARAFTQQSADIKQLQDWKSEMTMKRENELRDQTAYNFNLKADMVAIKTQLGMKEKEK